MTATSREWPSALASPNSERSATDRPVASHRHLVLLGLPGAGKSTVGPLVARLLKRVFVDLDQEIERREGRSVAAIFAADGEGAFRALEREVTAELLAKDSAPIVLAPGGGWVEDPAHQALLGGDVTAVYLQVSPAVAAARMGPATEARPLLAGGDAERKLGEVLARREALYLQSQHTVSVYSMTPSEVASSIVALA